MSEKYKIISQFVKDLSWETKDVETYLFVQDMDTDNLWSAITVFGDLPNLPNALVEINRIIKKNGIFQVVIPCEGSLAYSIARKISAERIFKKRYKTDYSWFINSEHINKPYEIFDELNKKFVIVDKFYFPIPIPFEFFNLCIGINLEHKT